METLATTSRADKEALVAELQKAITALNSVWPLLDRKDSQQAAQRQQLMGERRQLNNQLDRVLDELLDQPGTKLAAALQELQQASQRADEAKQAIDQQLELQGKVADVIAQAGKAVAAVASVFV